MRFIHCSDIHLGKTIRGNQERYLDYFKAFQYVVDLTISHQCDALVIAGDLFHYGNISPSTLYDTIQVIKHLNEKGIPIIAIEGNHDRFQRRKGESWLLFMSRQGYIYLLRPTEDVSTGTISFEAFDKEKGWGGWIDIKGCKFYGLGYWISSVAEQLNRALANVSEADVGILHAGVWDFDSIEIGKISSSEFSVLSKYFRYVALGHGHKTYKILDEEGVPFGYNPGSIEIVNREEAKDKEGIVYLVNLDTNELNIEPLKVPRRPFYDLKVDVEGCTSLDEVEERCLKKAKECMEKEDDTKPPILAVSIVGKVDFNPLSIRSEKIENKLKEELNPLMVLVENHASLVRSDEVDKSYKLDDLFEKTVEKLVRENPKYKDKFKEVTSLVFQIQRKIEDKEDEDEILEYIHHQRKLIEGE